MTNITNLNSQRFTLNGIPYYKNFLSQIIGDPVSGNLVRIVNAYDSKMELLRPTRIDEISVNGLTYPSAQALQNVLLPILYSRGTLGDGNSTENGIVQLGPLEIVDSPDVPGLFALKIPIEPVFPIWRIGGIDYTKETATLINIPFAEEGHYRVDTIVANTANGFERIQGVERDDVGIPPQLPYNVIEIAQIHIYGEVIGEPTPPPTGNQFITKKSKQYRSYRLTSELPHSLYLSHEYTTHILNLLAGSELVKGFVSFVDTPNPGDAAYDGMDIYIKNYGEVAITLTHNDATAGIPFWFASGEDLVIEQHQILHMKYNAAQNRVELLKLSNDGGAYSIVSDQVNQQLSLLDSEGNILSTISVAFLNNEGTTFFYNDVTEKLELQNDEGEVLSEIPVSAFVNNLASTLALVGSELQLKDTEGTVLSTVALTKAAVGLNNVDNTSDANKPVSTAQAAALALKANSSHTHSANDINSGILDILRLPAHLLDKYNQIGGQAVPDYGMSGLYDRTYTTDADLRGSVNINIVSGNIDGETTYTAGNAFILVNAQSDYIGLANCSDDLELDVIIDNGYINTVYGNARVQPFFQERNSTSSYARFRSIKMYVSTDGINWFTSDNPSDWQTTTFGNPYSDKVPLGFWFGSNGYSSSVVVWRYVKFEFRDLAVGTHATLHHQVYMTQLGVRHVSEIYAKQFMYYRDYKSSIQNWNEAHGWGNHADEDYATSSAISSAISALKGGVVTAGDTLAKLYALIIGKVSLTGNQTIAGKKTFSTVPASSQDASAATDLVRKSQMETAIKKRSIPITVYFSNSCEALPDDFVSRWVYTGGLGGELCLLASTSADLGKEIIFTNLTTTSVAVSVSSSKFYNTLFTGSESSVNSFGGRAWFRARVMQHASTYYFLILEQGILPAVGSGELE